MICYARRGLSVLDRLFCNLVGNNASLILKK